MSKSLVRSLFGLFFFTGVLSILFEQSQTASFRRYTSNVINCTVDKHWTGVTLTVQLKGELAELVGFFSNVNNTCKNNVVPAKPYQTGCDYNSNIFYLTLKNVTDADDGRIIKYTITYPSGTKTNTTTIDVQYSPASPPLITKWPEEPVIAGNKVVLSCEIPISNPVANITWRCNGFSDVTATTTPSTDKVVSSVERIASRADNNKECTCLGSHIFWTVDKLMNYTLIVYYLPTVSILPAGSQYDVVENTTNFILTCNVIDGNPAVSSYKWYQDGSKISSTEKHTISNVDRSDTGSYTCEATNTAGSSNSSFALLLNVLYGIEMIPISTNQPKEGDILNITCSGRSYPTMTDDNVIWTKKNESFLKKGQFLLINNVNRRDSGTYVCSVVITLTPTNGQSVNVSGTTNVNVDVLYLPTVTIYPTKSRYDVIENKTNFNLTCNATDANPAVTEYKWYKDGLEISSNAIYTILTVHRLDKGSYTCGSTNRAGSSNSSFDLQLNVLYGIELNSINKSQPKEGTGLNITCSGQSNPVLTDTDFAWIKLNSEGFSKKGRFLIIEHVNRTQSGTYACTATILLTPTIDQPLNVTATTTVEVDVLYTPTVIVSPDFNPSSVIENTTKLLMKCKVTDANPAAVSSYRWNKNGSWLSSAATYVISTVYRSHAGSYTCYAINSVGSSDGSPVFHLNVLYGVSLTLSESEINVNESERWDLSCLGEGNPIPTITCINEYNSSTVGEQKANVTSFSVEYANCMDTGIYTCSGNNAVGEPVSKSANIKVACKPRTYNNLDKEDVFINGSDASLKISTTFISFPLSKMSWFKQLPNGNLTELDSEFQTSTIPSQLLYEQTALIQKDRLEPSEFGTYIVKAFNIHGSFFLAYNVISKREPDSPTNVTASCEVTSITVSWISRFNGGENQTFRITLVNNISNQTTYADNIADKGINQTISGETQSLSPDTLYRIVLETYNLYGRTKSTETTNCTTKKNQVENQPVSSTLVGGITGSICALLIVVIVIGVLYFWHRRQVNAGDKKLIKRHSKETDEDDDGLKTNPLYVTSGEVSNAEVGPVYGVVNKKRQTKENMQLNEDNDQGSVYSQVQKTTTQEKKKGKEKKTKKTSRNENYKDIELGAVYENSDKVSKLNTSDELYANAGEPGKGVNLAKGNIPKKNKDGLIYADLDLMPGPNGRKFVIRGIENKTNYAMIDLSIKVDPLPSDDEEDKDSEKDNSVANECNE